MRPSFLFKSRRVLLLLLLSVVLPATAATSSFVSASGPYGGNPQSDTNFVRVETSGQHATSVSEAEASAAFGALKTRGEATLVYLAGENISVPNFGARADAEARASDSFVVGGVAAGTLGLLTFGIAVAGETATSAVGALPSFSFAFAGWEVRSNIGGIQRSIYRNETFRTGSEVEIVEGGFTGADPYVTHYFTQEFRFGDTISLDLQLNGTANALATTSADPGNFEAAFELGNSVYWGGISAVTLGDGTPVTTFTAIGASGTDYSRSFAPVPEPSTWLMLLLGSVLLTAHHGVRSTRQS